MELTEKKFEMSEDELPPFEFSGFALEYDKNGVLFQHQFHYQIRLETVHMSDDTAYLSFRFACKKLAWIENKRPDYLFEISQLAQVTEESFKKCPLDWIKRINRTIKYARGNEVGEKTLSLIGDRFELWVSRMSHLQIIVSTPHSSVTLFSHVIKTIMLFRFHSSPIKRDTSRDPP